MVGVKARERGYAITEIFIGWKFHGCRVPSCCSRLEKACTCQRSENVEY